MEYPRTMGVFVFRLTKKHKKKKFWKTHYGHVWQGFARLSQSLNWNEVYYVLKEKWTKRDSVAGLNIGSTRHLLVHTSTSGSFSALSTPIFASVTWKNTTSTLLLTSTPSGFVILSPVNSEFRWSGGAPAVRSAPRIARRAELPLRAPPATAEAAPVPEFSRLERGVFVCAASGGVWGEAWFVFSVLLRLKWTHTPTIKWV